MGKRPDKARSSTEKEEELLWKAEKIGFKTPDALVSSMWWLLTQFFVLNGPQEYHGMKMEDSQLCKNDKGVGRRSNKDETGRNAGQEQRFPATDVRSWWRKVSGCSLQAVCRAKTS